MVMEKTMRAFWTAALVTIAGPALAEPAKHDAPKSAQATRPAEVVLASADSVRSSPSVVQQPSASPKRPLPRVTTCRCGDPQASPDSEDQ